ncbi:MAG: hypothetical protein ACK5IQ_08940 [Bacteroidales bacterium]
MKKTLLMALSILFLYSGYAQEDYKLVVLPLMSPTIGDEPNPYLVSSALEAVLREKGINTTYKNEDNSVAPCEILFAKINKKNSMLRCKVDVEFTDCMNKIVWSNEGVGTSKDFQEGYGEAIADAFKDFEALPPMSNYGAIRQSTNIATEQAAVVPMSTIVPAKPAKTSEEYQPQQMYFGDSYIFDLQDAGSKDKKLIIMNGESKGYKKLEEVAKLKASDVSGIYNVEFKKPNGTTWTGMATENSSGLKISISNQNEKEEINLQKQ